MWPMYRSKLCENGLEISEKKKRCCTKYPGRLAQKKNKVRHVRGTICVVFRQTFKVLKKRSKTL
jgi:hypothetical protein